MFRYSIDFTAQSIDEGRLRDLLEGEFGVDECLVVRERMRGDYRDVAGEDLLPHEKYEVDEVSASDLAPGGVDEIEGRQDTLLLGARSSGILERRSKILKLFENGEMLKVHDIERMIVGFDKEEIRGDLNALCRLDRLHRVSHGVFRSTAFPPPTAKELAAFRKKMSEMFKQADQSGETLLQFLKVPKSSVDVEKKLGTSSSYTHKLLMKWVDKGVVFEAMTRNGLMLFCTDKILLDKEILKRDRDPVEE